MEMMAGRTLRERLRRYPRGMKPGEVLWILRDVAAGLAAAHEIGVLHRDVKPENVYLTKDGRAVLLDFGIARPVGTDRLTEADDEGVIIGTPGYMSPEQLRQRKLSAACDVWAAGILTYEMLAGRPPFHRSNTPATARAVMDDPTPALPKGPGPATHFQRGEAR